MYLHIYQQVNKHVLKSHLHKITTKPSICNNIPESTINYSFVNELLL